MKEIFFIISVIIFAVYTISVLIINKGIPKSYSITYYDIKHRWIFQAFIWIIALSCAYLGSNPFFILSGMLLVFGAGFHPTIKTKGHFIPHMIGAIGGIAMAVIFIIMTHEHGRYFLHAYLALASLSLIALSKGKRYIFAIEFISFTMVYYYFYQIIF